jgi:hypothetical protein
MSTTYFAQIVYGVPIKEFTKEEVATLYQEDSIISTGYDDQKLVGQTVWVCCQYNFEELDVTNFEVKLTPALTNLFLKKKPKYYLCVGAY